MSKEYVWTLTVDGEEKDWKCLVTDDACVIYEENVETNRLKIESKEKNTLQIDTVISVFGKDCGFQLENNIPYIKVNGKWTMSDTTFADRQQKVIYNQKLSAKVQILIGVALCAFCLIRYLITKDMGNWWFTLVLGSMMGVTGGVQIYSIRKEFGA